jgi:hypothetical protein
MSTEFEDVDDTELEEVEDPGFVGGGGPATTIFGEDDDLDDRGEDLARVDDDEDGV